MSAGLSLQAELVRGSLRLDLALSAAPGETVAMVGPSGSGKTTALRVIAGLLRPARGRVTLGERVLFDGEHGIDLRPAHRRVGLVFQDYALFPHLSARANVAYGVRGPRPRAVVEAWLERLGLREVAEVPAPQLSGGQRQRVALARALAAEPEALLLDEPLSALDLATRALVRGRLRALLAELGLPCLLVTHDPLDALMLSRRMVVLEEGRVTQEGSREALLDHPRSPFVAELGGVNLFRVQVSPGTGLKPASAGAVEFHVLADEVAGEAWVTFSPADVALSREAPRGSAQNRIAGTVSELIPLADRIRVHLEAGGPLLADVTRETVSAMGVQRGDRLWAAVKATALRVYV